ncbi:MAG: hypothetical protein JWM82_266, partial [Myxococcales bacterium]|nr:hypothetical protein [Myxococcales bacterium]
MSRIANESKAFFRSGSWKAVVLVSLWSA